MDMAVRYILVVDDNRAIHEDILKIINHNSNNNQLLDTKAGLLFGQNSVNAEGADSGYELIIDSAYQGEEAVTLVTQATQEGKNYALAFIDMRMPPGWDGLTTIEKIWGIDPDVQIVICTAYSDYSYEEVYQRLKATENFLILKKPFDMIEIKQMTAAMIKKWDLNREIQAQIKNLEELVKARTADLIQSAKMASIGQLAAGVAHEINNPIGYVISNNSILKKYLLILSEVYKQYESLLELIKPEMDERVFRAKTELLESNRSKNINKILADTFNIVDESFEGLERIKNIVKDLKTYSHAGHGDFERVNLIDCIESSLKIINSEIKKKCSLTKKYEELPLLWGCSVKLHQVFLNILMNATQAIKDKGEISITTELHKAQIVVTIADTGEGISPEHLDKLFDPFFTTKPVGVGTGLGLSISNNIIQQHKGTITVESFVGKGTAFKIFLPIK